ncbi:hypothetical protein DPV74_37645, partial [Burkholderia sp. HAN2018]|nr:hypothetical protein [Burkholderia sp. HAN2018]
MPGGGTEIAAIVRPFFMTRETKMNAASNARQANKTSETSATDARRSGDPHTVTPTRPRVRAAKPASR